MRRLPAAVLVLCAAALPAQAAPAPAAIDLAALIECRLDYASFMRFTPVLQDPLQAVALGWRPQPQANPFMLEYRLNQPITVHGVQTDHIAFAGDAVLAVLDLADPRPLARALKLETGVDTPQKALFGLEVRADEVDGPDGTPGWLESAVINVSNVDSHPGKTLAGCSYGLEPPEAADEAASGQPDAPASPPARQPR